MGALTYTPILDDGRASLTEEHAPTALASLARLRLVHSDIADLARSLAMTTRELRLTGIGLTAEARDRLKLGAHALTSTIALARTMVSRPSTNLTR